MHVLDYCCRAEFKEIRLLGTGNFSKVYLAQHRLDGLNYAVKRSAHRVCSDAAKRQWVQVSIICSSKLSDVIISCHIRCMKTTCLNCSNLLPPSSKMCLDHPWTGTSAGSYMSVAGGSCVGSSREPSTFGALPHGLD